MNSRTVFRNFKLCAPRIPFISNVTGTWITPEEATDPNYWTNHLRQAVRLTDGLGELLKEPNRVFLEVGPGRTMNTFLNQHSDLDDGQLLLSTIRSRTARKRQSETSDYEFFLGSLGELWESGLSIDWTSLPGAKKARRIPLPTYPFERKSYWIKPAAAPSGKKPQGKQNP